MGITVLGIEEGAWTAYLSDGTFKKGLSTKDIVALVLNKTIDLKNISFSSSVDHYTEYGWTKHTSPDEELELELRIVFKPETKEN